MHHLHHVMHIHNGWLGRRVFQSPHYSGILTGFFRTTWKCRSIASAASVQRKQERIEIPIGLSGSVKLDVFSPILTTTGPATTQRNILVHLPSGPSLGAHQRPVTEHDLGLQNLLLPTTTLVTIHYRLGLDSDDGDETKCFPIPIHDVSTALDFLTSPLSVFNEGQQSEPKLCLYGSHIGGGLATMLSLTRPNDIHAIAVANPMVDWVVLDEIVEQTQESAVEDFSGTPSASASNRRWKMKQNSRFGGVESKSILMAAKELIRKRSQLFKTPSAYFDPFASPILFLRAPGKDTPLATTVGDQMMQEIRIQDPDFDSFGPYDDDWSQSPSGSGSSPMTDRDEKREIHDSQSTGAEAEAVSATFVSDVAPTSSQESEVPDTSQPTHPPRRRKVLRRWPPFGRPEEVLLPHVKIFLQSPFTSESMADTTSAREQSDVANADNGLTALLRAQGTELAELMRRACFFGRESGFGNNRVAVSEESASIEFKVADASQTLTNQTAQQTQKAIEWADQMFEQD